MTCRNLQFLPRWLLGGVLTVTAASWACVDVLTFGFPGKEGPIALTDSVMRSIGPDEVHVYPVTHSEIATVGLFVQALTPGVGAVAFRLVHQGQPLASTTSAAGDTALYDEGSPPFAIGPTDYKLFVTSVGYSGQYRFHVFPHAAEAEGIEDPISIGDTIVSEIVPPGDLDDLTLVGPPGAEFTMAVSSLDATGPFRLGIEGEDSLLIGARMTANLGRRRLGESGLLPIRVTGANPRASRGRYRFVFTGIDRAPERAPALVLLGDTIFEEIDPAGDIDEFVIGTTPEHRFGTGFFEALSDNGGGRFSFVLLDSATDNAIVSVDAHGGANPVVHSFGRIAYRAGDRIRIMGADATGDRGAYRFAVRRFHAPPELAPEHLAATGDTVTETIGSASDLDEFFFTAQRDEIILVLVRALDPPGDRQLGFTLEDATSGATFFTHQGTFFGNRLHWVRRGMGRTGSYRIRVNPPELAGRSFVGPYELSFIQVRHEAEIIPTRIRTGEVVTGETLSPAGDIDVFTFSGNGDDLIAVRLDPPDLPVTITVRSRRVFERVRLRQAQNGDWVGALRFDGRHEIRFDPVHDTLDLGAYGFTVFRGTVAPETAAQEISVNQLVSDESVDFTGDEDTFLLQGEPGDTLRAAVRLLGSAPTGVSLTVIDPRGTLSRRILGHVTSASEEDFVETAPFVLRHSIQYPIRVQATSGFLGGYEFQILKP